MGEALGVHFGRRDLERVGLFAEMGYLHGKGYTAPIAHSDIRDFKRPQMNPGVPKWKTGLQDCYFDNQFKRIFEREAYTNPYLMDAHERKELKRKYPNMKPFLPAAHAKKHASPGDHFGTFSGIVDSFSPALRPRSLKEKLPPNFKTNPARKGGPGFTDICINKYPEYKSSPYDDPIYGKDVIKKKERLAPFLAGFHPSYFDKNPYFTEKTLRTLTVGPSKASKRFGAFFPSGKNKTLDGCFSKWPEHRASPFAASTPARAAALRAPFLPQPRNKSMYTRSVMNHKVDVALNANNWQHFKPITYNV